MLSTSRLMLMMHRRFPAIPYERLSSRGARTRSAFILVLCVPGTISGPCAVAELIAAVFLPWRYQSISFGTCNRAVQALERQYAMCHNDIGASSARRQPHMCV